MLTLNTNTASQKVANTSGKHNSLVGDVSTKLASGHRINSAKDDAAGLQISNRLISQTRGNDVAVRNANDAVSMLQTADAALEEYTEILMRMRDITLQAGDGAYAADSSEIKALFNEYVELRELLIHIQRTTKFAGSHLFQHGKTNDGTKVSSDKRWREASEALIEIPTKQKVFRFGQSSADYIKFNLPNFSGHNDGSLFFHSKSARATAGADWKTNVNSDVSVLLVKDGGSHISHKVQFKENLSIEKAVQQINRELREQGLETDILSFGNSGAVIINNHEEDIGYWSIQGANLPLGIPVSKTVQGQLSPLDISLSLGSYNYMPITSAQRLKDNTSGFKHNSTHLTQRLDHELKLIGQFRSEYGAAMNRLESTINNLQNESINTSSASSRFKDTDFAKATTELTKRQVLSNMSGALLSQANNIPRTTLELLK